MRLLLAEDDPILADALSANLRSVGFEVEVAENGAVAEYLLLKHPFDIGVIDIGLPLVDGLTVLKRAHAARPTLPLIVLTAMDGLESRVAGLNAGADDYMTKPFDFPELEARIRALLRRARFGGGQPPLPTGQAASNLRISLDADARRATVNGQHVDLSPREWALLEQLFSNEGRVVTKEQINSYWAGDAQDAGSASGSLEVIVHRLRRKLEGSGVSIRTVRGLGYLLEQA